jgi:beta-lactamase superfamily II metal-dependent hydrolase
MNLKNFKRLLIFAILPVLFFAGIAKETKPGDVNLNIQLGVPGIVFSEVLYDSWVSGESEGEWLELYNSSASSINIGGWTIEDVDQTYTIPSGTTIGPGCYLVIADGQTTFNSKYGCNPHLGNMNLQLNNNGGYLKLKNTSGTVIDQVAWESGGSSISGWGSSTLPYADNDKSIVRSNLNLDTDTYSDWLSDRTPNPNCGGTPKINLNATQLNFSVNAGGTGTQTFSVSNSGCGMLNWTVSDDVGWLNCSPASGTNSGQVTASVNTSGLSTGTYNGTVTVTDPAASNSPGTVNVTLTVTSASVPQISLSTTKLDFDLIAGETGTQDFSISNSGSGTLNWTVSDDAGWLTCSPVSGTDLGTVTVTVNTNGLVPDTYTGTITVSDPNAGNSPRTVSVGLTVNDTGGAKLEIHYINVQQGQSILIIGPDGTTILVDGGDSGKGFNSVVPYLLALGIETSQALDYMIATHLDGDHFKGLTEVMNYGYDVLNVYDNGSDKTDSNIDAFNTAAGSTTAGGVTPIPLGHVINMGGATATCVAVNGSVLGAGLVPGGRNNENDRSIGLLIQYGNFDYLVTGDMGGGDDDEDCTGRSTTQANIETSLAQAIMPGGARPLLSGYGVEVLHVAHHGSESSTNSDFMNRLTPKVACISVGDEQRTNYQHPRKDVVENVLLAQAGCITAPPALILQTEEGRPIGDNTSFAGYSVGDIVITTGGVSTYTVSASGAVSQGPDERSSAGLPETFYFDEGTGPGVVFSEVLYDSWVNSDLEGEWLELYNSASSAIDIGDWTIEDNDRTYYIPAGTTIEPQSYLVIADGQAEFVNKYDCYPHLSDLSLKLNNDDGYLTLRNSENVLIDQVAWETGGSYISGWGSTSLPYADAGKSIVRQDVNNDTDTFTDWLSNRTPDPACNDLPQIDLSTARLDFEVNAGESGSLDFSIANSGYGTLNWTVSDNKSWLSCSPGSGTGSGLVTVTVNTTGLTADTYYGMVTVTSANASNSPQTVQIILAVKNNVGIPQISLGAAQLNFQLNPGETGAQDVAIANSGSGTLNWTVSDNRSWLTCNPASGTNSGIITVSVDTNGLSTGTHTGTVTVAAANAANTPKTVQVVLVVADNQGIPGIGLSRTELFFGASGGVKTSSQTFLVGNSGGGTLRWTVNDNAPWLISGPLNGTGPGVVDVSVNTSGLVPGTYMGKVYVNDSNASNSPQSLSVTINVYQPGSTISPFGTFATPISGTTVSSSIPVTGWVVDDIEVIDVKIYAETNNGTSYVGDAVFVEGARPDVEQAHPGYPKNYQAGWGYMMLTNFLPGGGNGWYTFYAIATDAEGHRITLGSKTVFIDNDNAIKPFGAIDTPAQGGLASGSDFINWGWVLTPQPNKIPVDGSTIFVWVDGVKLGNPIYNIYRSDIAELFPDYANSDGAVGYFYLDTTGYENGVHTIQWTATDSAGNTDGIGSRYFTIRNTGSSPARIQMQTVNAFNIPVIPINRSGPVAVKKGLNIENVFEIVNVGEQSNYNIELRELERVEIDLMSTGVITGYMVIGAQFSPLPIGSTLDFQRGKFYWQTGPGYVGTYRFVFIEQNADYQLSMKPVVILIKPRFSQ